MSNIFVGEQLYLSLSSALRRSLSPATHNRRAMKHFHMKIDYGSSFPFVSFFYSALRSFNAFCNLFQCIEKDSGTHPKDPDAAATAMASL